MNRPIALAALAALLASPAAARPVPAAPIAFPDRFDSIGTPVQRLATRQGRTVFYTDTGEAGWTPVVFIGGVGTSGRAPELVAFLDTMRQRLRLRLIAVERNGLGDTPFDPAWTAQDYSSEVAQVLDHLGVGRFSLVAISGGGYYAGHLVQTMPQRITSWHMLAAIASAGANTARCAASEADFAADLGPQVAAPRVWWDMPAAGVAAKVRGFSDRTADEGAHAFFIAGQKGDARGVAREYKRFCDPAADVSAYTGPAWFYYGEADTAVPPAQGRYWAGKARGRVTFRSYPDEGHDVQYRHWDQVMLDIAGYGAGTLVCTRGKARIVPGLVTPAQLAAGSTLGVCAWQKSRA